MKTNKLINGIFEGVVAFAEVAASADPDEKKPLGERFVHATAVFAGKQRDALMTQGFTREEAVLLVGQQMKMFGLNNPN